MIQLPIRVLIIGPAAYKTGDSSHFTFAIWRELARGFQQLKVLARAQGPGGSWMAEDVQVELIRGFLRREFEFLVTQFALVRRGYAYKPHVVVSQGVALGGWAAIIIARLCGAGALIEVHNDDFTQRAPLLSRRGLLQCLSRPVFSHATLIRVLSERMGEALVTLYGQHLRAKIRVLPPRVDTNKFRPPKTRDAPNGRLSLAIVGSLNQRKGQLRLINALEEADLPIDLHIVGEGSDRTKIEHKIAKLNSKDFVVIMHGQVSHDELSRILAKSDALIMYSSSEGTPRAIMEAMATGLPVITTDVGFCRDVVEHGREGIVLPADGTDAELANQLRSLLSNLSDLRRMGDAALKRARRQFSAGKLYPRYRAIIAEASSQ